MMGKAKSLVRKLKTDDFWHRLVKNVSTIVVGQGGASALNMITAFLTAACLGVGGYGSLMIGLTFMQAVDAFLNFQSWQGVIRYGSFCLEDKNEHGLAATIKAGFFVDFASAIIGCAVAFAIVPFVAGALGWEEVSTTAALIFCVEIVVHIEGTPTGVLRLFDKFKYVAIHAAASAALKLLLVGIALGVFGFNVLAVACAYCLADMIKSVSLFLIAACVVSKRMGLSEVARSSMRNLPKGFLSFTVWSNLDATADAPIMYFDVFFLSLLSSEAVGVFKLFKQLLSSLTLLSSPVQQAIMPQLAELIAKGLYDQAYSVVVKIRKVVVKIVAPCAVAAIAAVPPLLAFFLDPVYGSYWVLFAAMASLSTFGISFSALHPCFSAYGLSRQSAIITFFSNFIYLVACYLLIGEIGVMAIPMAMAMQYFLVIVPKIVYIKKYVLV